jgi:predicted AAA+ superfamily ATPase
MLLRNQKLEKITNGFQTSKIVAILGPRQCGKTTLARQYFASQQGKPEHYFDLEDPLDIQRMTDPMLALDQQSGFIVIDEMQLRPDLFPILRVLVDRATYPKQFLILGSASRDLVHKSSETLAGRIHYLELTPFNYEEIIDTDKHPADLHQKIETLWLRGGFPLSYLAANALFSLQWRKDYIKTYLEQDIPKLGITIPAEKLRRFWIMLTHYHGQILNASKLANSMDLSHHTIQNYLDILTGTFMIRQLSAWHENIKKRQVKAKKIYFRDSGILHALSNIQEYSHLLTNPIIGASWEGFALEAIINAFKADPQDCYFWSTHTGAELDLLITMHNQKIGFEFKFTKNPKVTPSMLRALEDLTLEHLYVIYPGELEFSIHPKITFSGLTTSLQKIVAFQVVGRSP